MDFDAVTLDAATGGSKAAFVPGLTLQRRSSLNQQARQPR